MRAKVALVLVLGCGAVPPAEPSVDDVARLCDGVPDELRERGPFEGWVAVESVVARGEREPKSEVTTPRGADVVVRPSPGVTRAWLGRVCACHAAVAGRSPGAPDDPLAPRGTVVNVTETSTSLVVEIRAPDPDAAREIARRAMRIRPPS